MDVLGRLWDDHVWLMFLLNESFSFQIYTPCVVLVLGVAFSHTASADDFVKTVPLLSLHFGHADNNEVMPTWRQDLDSLGIHVESLEYKFVIVLMSKTHRIHDTLTGSWDELTDLTFVFIEQWKKSGGLGYIGDYTTQFAQLCVDYKPF